jgi:2'-5' RNA ligase
MDKKRIFIAIPASEDFRKRAMKFSLDHNEDLPVRWLAGRNLHITLVPPIEAEPQEIEKLKVQLKTISELKPFEVHFNTIDFGPDNDEPRLIWTKGEAPTELYQLKDKIDNAIGYRPDRTNFIMHITLARFSAKNFKPEWRDKLQTSIHGTMLVDKFVVMEVKDTNGIREYPILEEFLLQ